MPTSYQPSASGTPTISGGGSAIPTWVTLTPYALNFVIQPTVQNGLQYKATTGGTSGASQPTWPTIIGNTVSDGSVVWTCTGTAPQGGIQPPITEPVGTDNRTSTSVDNPLNQIGDYLAYLLNQAPLIGNSYSGLVVNPVTVSVQASGFTAHAYKLLSDFAGGSALNHQRMFIRDDGVLVFTINCAPNAAKNAWSADAPSNQAMAIYFGARMRATASTTSRGFSVVSVANPNSKAFSGANTWTDDDSVTAFAVTANSWDVPYLDFGDAGLVSHIFATFATVQGGARIGGTGTTGVTSQTPILPYVHLTGASVSITVSQACICGVVPNAGGTAFSILDGGFPTAGQIFIIKDENGTAGTNNITVTSSTAGTIDNAASKVINTNFGVLRIYNAGSGKYFTF